ncbi:adenosine kinase [Horticoccus luteus]|uniref:Adenosine kinase n=1 Tax=Horticoccus luteus TaxID=2862869 RepID=A0A8F9TVJ9_9BACT|nr:adenosine kinase [Horticoccus luteus]QYM80054.1 adenosine kinase [Horticoccus luteus]
MSHSTFDLVGVGNPIMDLLAHVPESFLTQHVPGDKGGMVLVDDADLAGLVRTLDGALAIAPGGSAANTILSAAQLGLRTSYVGKVGSDPTAAQYLEFVAAAGTDSSHVKRATLPHGRCLSLVTPDGQRTMRTHLGAAMTLSPAEISPADFQGARHAHIEGYLLFNPALAEQVITSARAAGCTISIDLASFEVVKAARDWIFAQLRLGVDIVFANEDEASALFDRTDDYANFARELAAFGGIAAVKLGKDGAWLAQRDTLHRVAPVTVSRVVDTTGAGDAWAAGFLYGHLRGASLAHAGAVASILGAECVQHLGAAIPHVRWPQVRGAALPHVSA